MRLIILSGFILINYFLVGQTNDRVIDSLEQVLASTTEETAKMKLLLTLGDKYLNKEPERAFKYYQQLNNIALEVNNLESITDAQIRFIYYYWTIGKVDTIKPIALATLQLLEGTTDPIFNENKLVIYNTLGVMADEGGQYQEALAYYKKATNWAEDPQKYSIILNIGSVYLQIGDYSSALKNYLQVVEYQDKNEDQRDADVYSNIAFVYDGLGETDKGIEYLEKALKEKNIHGEQSQGGRLYIKLALAKSYLKLDDPRGFPMLEQVFVRAKEINSEFITQQALQTLVQVSINRGTLDEAKRYGEALLKMAQNYTPKENKRNFAYYKYASVLNHQKAFRKALPYARQAVEGYQLSGELEIEDYPKALRELAIALQHTGNFKETFEVLAIKDSIEKVIRVNTQKTEIANAEVRLRLKETELAYQKTEIENELKITEAKGRQNVLLSILGGLGIIFMLGFFAYRRVQSANKIIQKQANDLLQQAQLKTRFFNNVAHELRTPLTLILGPINAALNRNKLDAQDFTYLKMARRNGNQLLLLVHSILDLSKLEVNKLTLEETTIDFYPLITRLVAAFESSAEIQGINLIADFPPNAALHLQLDAPKFEIIINNLLSNALKFTPKGGKIDVQVQASQSQIEIKVADTGKGIEAEDLPFIFDRYYQTKKPNQPLEGGTGIGLALCKEYAQLFKGAITAKSIVGKGSTFTLVFPKKEAIPITTPIASTLPPLIENNSIEIIPTSSIKEQKDKAHLLIVEDNKDMRLYIQSILGDTFQCHTAENGQVAWDYLNDAATIQPDLIISDLMMPFMDGFELLEKIKADDKWRTTPVIMLTARSAKEDRLKALTIGIDDYLTKPFDPEELVARVNNLLQNHLARKLQRQAELPTAKGVSPEAIQFKPVTAADIEWIHEVNEKIKADIGKFDLNLLNISYQMAISERHLRRRILEITGMKAGAYLKEIRLQQARHFLESKAYLSVAEVGYAVGFNTPNYFAKIYKARFGKLPKAYF